MTKVFALLSIAAVFAFASCAEKAAEVSNEDTTSVVVPVEAAPAPDTTAIVAPDTTVKVEAPAAK